MEPIYSFDIAKYSLKPAIITRLIENRVIYSQLQLASREPHCLRALWHTVSSPLHYWLPICTFVTPRVCICIFVIISVFCFGGLRIGRRATWKFSLYWTWNSIFMQCSFYSFIIAILSNYLYLISQINIYKSQNIENKSTYRQTRCAAKVKTPCSIARAVLLSRKVELLDRFSLLYTDSSTQLHQEWAEKRRFQGLYIVIRQHNCLYLTFLWLLFWIRASSFSFRARKSKIMKISTNNENFRAAEKTEAGGVRYSNDFILLT